MGLDQYLSARKYVSNYKFSGEQSNKEYQEILKLIGLKDPNPETPSACIEVDVAYWRKANQVHAWFVENAQGGNDDCGSHDVSREQLEKLVALCKEALAKRERAPELLPTAAGCFFGSTEYSDYYFSDLENTVKQIQAVLDNPIFDGEDWDFQYRSSW